MGQNLRFLLSGGGTGGHIFPAIAIADELKSRYPDAEFLFIGASDKMEMQKIPQAGYKIEGLWISGIERSNLFKNFSFPFKIGNSLLKCKKIIKDFKPTIAIGTGGFASGPALWTAHNMGIPIFLQEQNSFPGITNKLLAKKATKIFVAYDGMDKFFPKEKIVITGNPVRKIFDSQELTKDEALDFFDLDKSKLTILSIGGSLGSKTLNSGWKNHSEKILGDKVQLIWQTGALGYEDIIQDFLNSDFKKNLLQHISIKDFIKDMLKAYTAADIIVSRAGAIAISELCIAGKPTILVPFPYAAEDHQTKNAQKLVNNNAAIMVNDKEFVENAKLYLNNLIENEDLRKSLANNLQKFAKPNATNDIVDEIIKSI